MSSQATSQIRSTLAANIRTARQRKGITQRQLAAQVNGVDSLAVSRWERGANRPSDHNLAALAHALGVDPAWLYTDHTGKKRAA